MRHDKVLLYLIKNAPCPVPVSVRLPTNSCTRGCYFCCFDSWRGKARYSLFHTLTIIDFLRLWKKIIIDNDFRFVWPQGKILKALQQHRWLRFVREELFEPTLDDVTKSVLSGCRSQGYGLLVKTSSLNVVNFISDLKKIKHCIVFSVTDLLDDYFEKIEIINHMVASGLRVTLSLKPIFEYSSAIKYILSAVDSRILGVEVGWLYGNPEWIPKKYLCRCDYKVVNREKQYLLSHLRGVVSSIRRVADERGIPVRFYFSSQFFKRGACCFADVCG